MIKHFLPNLYELIDECVHGKRDQRDITYSQRYLLMTRILAAVMEGSSMRAMTDKFNTDISIENMEELCGEKRGAAILENDQ